MCKTLEVKQKRVKLVDASKRRGCESACGEGRESRGRAGVAGANGKCWAQKRSPLRRAVEVYVEIGKSGGRMKISRLRYQG